MVIDQLTLLSVLLEITFYRMLLLEPFQIRRELRRVDDIVPVLQRLDEEVTQRQIDNTQVSDVYVG